MRAIYLQCGMKVRSPIELPLPMAPDGQWDVDVHWASEIGDSAISPDGEVVATYVVDDVAWYTAVWTGSDYVMRFRNVGEFVISGDLARVAVRPQTGGQAELIPVLLAGTVSAFVLAVRGATVLHASAVLVDGQAIAFVGQSGRGKSTVAALLCVDGGRLITDDVLAVDPGPPITCIGGAAELRLREKAAPIAHEHRGAVTRTTEDARLGFAPPPAPPSAHPLAAIVVPSPNRTEPELSVSRIPPTQAVLALLAFPRIHGWKRAEVLSRDLATFGAIANDVPVYHAQIPWGPPFDPQIAKGLAALVAGDGNAQPAVGA